MALSTTSYRKQVAVCAAQLLAEGFVQDYHSAKLKAIKRLGLTEAFDLPSNEEVETELKRQQSLFGNANCENSHDQLVYAMRLQALEAMKMFKDFSPRLTGPVLEGTSTRYSPIEVQVFSESPKEIVIKLLDFDVPFNTEDRRMKMSKIDTRSVPVFSFGMGDYEVALVVLEPNDIRQSPLSPITGAPMERASIKKLKKMLSLVNSDVNLG